ncbi:MAG: hypothetical protein CFE21_01815 [Bacteroidetes bacterium B1(2017)]|nr:MAG: hypothetical protein CFE21_01815 [Bacteroidetes bacterium B1(2017)]
MRIGIINAVLFFMFFFLFTACNPFSKNSSQSASIEGKIPSNFTRNKTLYFFRYTDSLSLFLCEKKPTDSCEIKPDGSFKLELKNWNSDGFFDLATTEFTFAKNYFLEQNQNLHLFFEGNDMPLKLSTYQDIGEYNLFLQTFYDTFFREPATKRNYFVISNFMLAPDYAVYINERREHQKLFYKNYFNGQEINNTFKTYFEKELDFNWANDKVYFLWKKRTRQEFVPLDTSYFDFLKVINLDDPSALISPAYTRFIELYLTELYQEELPNLPVGLKQTSFKIAVTGKKLKGLGKKIAYYQLIKNELNGVNLSSNPAQVAYVDSLTNLAFASTGDSAYFRFVKSERNKNN